MDKELKIALAVIAGALVVTLGVTAGVYLVGRQFIGPTSTSDTAQASRIGHQIANYNLPPGYHERTASNSYGYKMVMIGAQSDITGAMTIMLIESPGWPNMGQPDLAGLEQPEQDADSLSLGTVSTQTVMIKGRPVIFTTSDSESGDWAYRQVRGAWPGRGNSIIMMMVLGAKETWDQAALDIFWTSIR
jgi:hypothetical protein